MYRAGKPTKIPPDVFFLSFLTILGTCRAAWGGSRRGGRRGGPARWTGSRRDHLPKVMVLSQKLSTLNCSLSWDRDRGFWELNQTTVWAWNPSCGYSHNSQGSFQACMDPRCSIYEIFLVFSFGPMLAFFYHCVLTEHYCGLLCVEWAWAKCHLVLS